MCVFFQSWPKISSFRHAVPSLARAPWPSDVTFILVCYLLCRSVAAALAHVTVHRYSSTLVCSPTHGALVRSLRPIPSVSLSIPLWALASSPVIWSMFPTHVPRGRSGQRLIFKQGKDPFSVPLSSEGAPVETDASLDFLSLGCFFCVSCPRCMPSSTTSSESPCACICST